MKLIASRNSVQGLLTYYISLFGFVSSCVLISQGASAVKIAGLLLTFVAILIHDVQWLRRSRAHPHDMQLADQLTSLLQGNGTDLFLKQHDFSTHSYDEAPLEVFRVIEQDWQGVDYEFLSPGFQQAWVSFREHLDQLTTLMTHDVPLNGMNFYHLLPPSKTPVNDAEAAAQAERAEQATRLARQVYEDFQAIRQHYHECSRVLAIRT